MIADMSTVDVVTGVQKTATERSSRPGHVRLAETVLSGSAIFNSYTAPRGMAGALLDVLDRATGISRASFHEQGGKEAVDHALSSQEMLEQLNSCGISVSNLAAITDVSRPTIYSWLEGAFPSPEKQHRIELVHRLLNQLDAASLRILPKIWLRRANEYLPSVYEVLTARAINVGHFNDAIQSLKPMLDKLTRKANQPAATVAEEVHKTLAAAQTQVAGWDTMPPVGDEI